jgi:hypothetical protein
VGAGGNAESITFQLLFGVVKGKNLSILKVLPSLVKLFDKFLPLGLWRKMGMEDMNKSQVKNYLEGVGQVVDLDWANKLARGTIAKNRGGLINFVLNKSSGSEPSGEMIGNRDDLAKWLVAEIGGHCWAESKSDGRGGGDGEMGVSTVVEP